MNENEINEWIKILKENDFESSKCSECLLLFIEKMKNSILEQTQRKIMKIFQQILKNSPILWLKCKYSSNLSFQLLQQIYPSISFNTFISIIKSNRTETHELVLFLLQELLKNNFLKNLFLAEIHRNRNPILQNNLIRSLLSLPDVISRFLPPVNRSHVCHHVQYYRLLAFQMTSCLDHVTTNCQQPSNLAFLSNVLGQSSNLGKNDIIFDILIPYFNSNILKPNFLSLIRRLLSDVTVGIEGILICILRATIEPDVLVYLFDDLIVKNRKVEELMTSRLLFSKYFDDFQIILNIFYYISSIYPKLLIQLLRKSLEIWCLEAFMSRSPFEQHHYVTAVVICCARFIRHDDVTDEYRSCLMEMLMKGMKEHLDSPDQDIRSIAMVTAEYVTDLLQVTSKLRFEYDSNNKVIKKLTNLVEKEVLKAGREDLINREEARFRKSIAAFTVEATNQVVSDQLVYSTNHNLNDLKEHIKVASSQNDDVSDLDSDDDIEPLYIPEEKPFSKHKIPVYIDDFIEAITHKDIDVEKFTVCMTSLNNLIEKCQHEVKEVSQKLCHLLLNLENKFDLEFFDELRKSAMMKILITDPEQIGQFLADEFYSSKYAIQTRLTILDVVVMTTNHFRQIPKRQAVEVTSSTTNDALPWKKVVEDRIEKKTRRFTSRRREPRNVVATQLVSVAGFLFYPFIQYFDRKIPTLDLLQTDTSVLCRLIFAMTSVCDVASNCPKAPKMASDALGFVVSMRCHGERVVRRSVILSCSILLPILIPFASSDPLLLNLIFETRQWLCDVIEANQDAKCVEGAIIALTSVQQKMKTMT